MAGALWRGAAGRCARVRACAGAAESLHKDIHTSTPERHPPHQDSAATAPSGTQPPPTPHTREHAVPQRPTPTKTAYDQPQTGGPGPGSALRYPQAEGVLLRAFDDRSRVRGQQCVACLRARFARTLPSRLPYGVA